MKQTKSMRFRELLPIILELENSDLYLQDGIIEILKDKYDLDITLLTYRNYLHRYARKSTESFDEDNQTGNKQKTDITSSDSSLKDVDKYSASDKDSDDEQIDPKVLLQLKAELERDKTTLTSKPLFD